MFFVGSGLPRSEASWRVQMTRHSWATLVSNPQSFCVVQVARGLRNLQLWLMVLEFWKVVLGPFWSQIRRLPAHSKSGGFAPDLSGNLYVGTYG